MLPQSHLPQLIPNRVNAAVQRLAKNVWTEVEALMPEATQAQPKQVTLSEAKTLKRKAVGECSFWGKLFDQRWCYLKFAEKTDGQTWLFWTDQGEATLYVNNEPYFGFNVAHRSCRLPKGIKEVWIQSSCVQSAIWHPEANGMDAKGSYFEGAWLRKRDDTYWNGYHDLKCFLDLALDQRHRENPQVPTTLAHFGQQPLVDKFSPEYRHMLHGMDLAVDAFDSEGVEAMRKVIADLYKKLRLDQVQSHCILTGHAHLDLVWIWPERIGELKAVNIFASMNHLMGEYPELRFAYSQPASYETVKRREPKLFKHVEQRLSQGQWQATGAMYVESDTMLACGEALSRSFVLGQKGFTELVGKPSTLTWLPDVFGYSACMPQIMQQTGVDYFFTTKMTWNAINRFPHSSFIWKGNDGSEVLAHVTQESGYVTHVTVDNVKAPMHANQQAAIHPEYLLPTGYGDGGGGVTDEMLERAKRLNQLPGMPKISWDHPEAFFERLSEVSDQLPVHQGECYLEYHRGTFTTHSNLKHAFRDLERALQLAEAASILTGKRWDLEHSWKRLVFSQFHDYIPGSSVWDVYLEGVPELESLAKEQRKKVDEVLSHGKSARSLDCWFNPHGVDVIRWLKVPGKKRPIYTKLPALSGTSIKEAALESPTAVSLNGKVASNGVTEFRINRNGWIDRLTWENVSVPLQRPLGQFVLYPDRAANFEPWDIDRHVLSLGNICKEKAEIKEIRKGDHSAGYEVVRSIGKQSQATVRFLLEAGSPLVHVEIDLDWQEEQTLLKFYLPTEYAATNARFGIPFGSVLRSQVPDSMAAEAMWEVPFSRYLAVFDEGEREGLFVISESKYGACVRNGEVGVSLVRSPRVTGMDGAGGHGRAWPPHLTRLKNLPSCSDLGKHQIRLALGRYDMELPRERQPASLADTLFTDPVFYKGNAMPSIIQSISGGDTLIPCWAKPSEKGGWSLRFQEVAGRRGSMQVSVVPGWKLHLSNLSETEKMPLNTKNQINFKPYQVVTLRLEKE